MNFIKSHFLLGSSFLLVISSYIPLGFLFQGRAGGSLFDLISIPLLVYLSILIIKRKAYIVQPSSILLWLSLLFAFLSIFPKSGSDGLFLVFAVFFRYASFIAILLLIKSDFILHELKCVFHTFSLKRLVLYVCFFYLFNFILSSYYYVIGSWRFGFPFYSDGIDPHVWGPSLSFTLIFLFSIFSNLRFFSYRPGYTKVFLLITMLFCLILSLLSSSRGALLVLISTFCLYFLFKTVKHSFLHLNMNALLSRLIGLTLPLSFLAILALIFILPFYSFFDLSGFRWDHLSFVFTRTFSVFDILQGSDVSRGDAINRSLSYVGDVFMPISKMFGGKDVLSVSDSGIIFTIENYGFLSAICLFSSVVLTMLNYRKNASYVLLTIPLLCLSLIGSESYILPRLVLFSLPAMILSRFIAIKYQRLV